MTNQKSVKKQLTAIKARIDAVIIQATQGSKLDKAIRELRHVTKNNSWAYDIDASGVYIGQYPDIHAVYCCVDCTLGAISELIEEHKN